MNTISIQFRKSTRARRLRIAVKPTGEVVVTIPRRVSERLAQRFVREHATWIQQAVKKVSARRVDLPWTGTRTEYVAHKERARDLITQKLQHFNEHYGFSYRSISVRNQRTRWGSCSRRGRLNFNYRIAFLPDELVNYIIVHELCHLKEMNHSRQFWTLMQRALPNATTLRRSLHRLYPL